MFGMVAATGIKILGRVDYGPRHNLLIVAIGIALGMIPLVAPTFFDQLPKWLGPITHSGITLTAIAAVVLNAFFNGPRDGETIGSELVDVAKEGSLE